MPVLPSLCLAQKAVKHIHPDCLLLPPCLGDGGCHVGLLRLRIGQHHHSDDEISGFVPLRFRPRHPIHPHCGAARILSQEGSLSQG